MKVLDAKHAGRSSIVSGFIPAEPLDELDLPALALELGGQLG